MNSAQEASWGGGSGWSQGVAEHGRDDPQEQLAMAREQSFRDQSAAIAAEQAAAQFAEQQRQDNVAAQVLANVQQAAAARAAEQQLREQQARDEIVGRASMGFNNLGGYSPSPIDLAARYGYRAPSVMTYLDAGKPYSGLLGSLTGNAYSQLQSGVGQPVTSGVDAFGNPRVIGSFTETPFGGTVYSGRQDPDYTGAYANLVRPYDDSATRYRDDRPEVVGSITDTATGEEKCPTGYMFDEDLQACRLDTGMAGTPVDDRNDGTAAYARMGLLDVAPDFSGSAFGDGAGFGAANLAFRRRGATRPDIFRTRPSLEGYTLLS